MGEESSMIPKYRLDISRLIFKRAQEEIDTAIELINLKRFNASVNRSYYAMFYAVNAVNMLDGFESSKHSGVISHFNFEYVRTKIFDPSLSKLISSAFNQRHYADYEYSYIATQEEAQAQINDAQKFLDTIRPYLESKWKSLQVSGDNQNEKA